MKTTAPSRIIPAAIVLLGLVAGYYYYSTFGSMDVPPAAASSRDALSRFKRLGSINLEVLGSPVFKSLKVIGEVPVAPGSVGRTDIFAPF